MFCVAKHKIQEYLILYRTAIFLINFMLFHISDGGIEYFIFENMRNDFLSVFISSGCKDITNKFFWRPFWFSFPNAQR